MCWNIAKTSVVTTLFHGPPAYVRFHWSFVRIAAHVRTYKIVFHPQRARAGILPTTGTTTMAFSGMPCACMYMYVEWKRKTDAETKTARMYSRVKERQRNEGGTKRIRGRPKLLLLLLQLPQRMRSFLRLFQMLLTHITNCFSTPPPPSPFPSPGHTCYVCLFAYMRPRGRSLARALLYSRFTGRKWREDRDKQAPFPIREGRPYFVDFQFCMCASLSFLFFSSAVYSKWWQWTTLILLEYFRLVLVVVALHKRDC